MTPKTIQQKIEDFRNAVKQLNEALSEDLATNILSVDGTLKRFEFTFEMAWKLARKILLHNGVDIPFDAPRPLIKEAYKTKIIGEGQKWLDMLDARNKTAHVYDQQEALDIYYNIKNDYFFLLSDFAEKAEQLIQWDNE